MSTVAPPRPAKKPKQAANRPPVRGVRETQRTLNVPLLIGTLVALAILVPCAYFWHSFQLSRASVAYLDRAQALEEEGNWSKASKYLHRYLRVHPKDVETRARLAQTYDKGANDRASKARAVEFYYRAIGLAPDRADLRRRLADLLVELGQFVGAEEEARKLLATDPKDPTALRVQALAAYGKHRVGERNAATKDELVTMFKQALAVDPSDERLALTLAHIYRRELHVPSEPQRQQIADALVDNMVDKSENPARAYLARHRYRTQHKLPGAEEDIERAAELGKDDFEVLVTAGFNARRLGREAAQQKRWNESNRYYAQGLKYFEAAVEQNPKSELGHLGRGVVLFDQGRAGLAVDAWREGLDEAGMDSLDLNAQLARTLTALERLDEVGPVLERLDRSLEHRAPRMTRPERMRVSGVIDFLRARWAAANGDHFKAISLLRRLVAGKSPVWSSASSDNDQFDAWLLLGKTYLAVGQWDEAVQALESARRIQPDNKEVLQLAARASTNAGRLGAAEQLYDELADTGGMRQAVWLPHMETQLRNMLSRPEKDRDWASFKAELENAPRALRNSWQRQLLQADLAIAQGGPSASEEALSILAEAEEKHPNEAGLFQKLTLAYERLSQPQNADRALRKVKELGRGTVGILLTEAELLGMRGSHDKALATLRKALESAPPDQTDALHYAIYRQSMRAGKLDEARAELLKLREAHRANLGLVRDLAELDFARNDFQGVERWEDELKKLEGEEGTQWRYYRARRLLAQSQGDNSDPRFLEAVSLQKFIDSRRATWPAGQLLKGHVAQRMGNRDDAIRAYRKAIELGESRSSVYERLATLLLQADRWDEAQQYLSQLGRHGSGVREEMEWIVARGQGETKRAVELAEQGVARAPKDPRQHVRLAQSYMLDGQMNKAERAFQEGVELAPTDIQVWNHLLTYYLRTGQKDAAERTLAGLSKRSEISESQRAFVLAQAYEILADSKKAKSYYADAERLSPDDTSVLKRVAERLVRTDPPAAEKKLRRVLELAPGDAAAERMLAQMLFERGDDASLEEVKSLLGVDAGDSRRFASSPESARLWVAMLVRRAGTENLLQARRILQELIRNPNVTRPSDRLLLARLYERENKIQAARDQYLKLVTGGNPAPEHLTVYIEFLLRHDDPTGAKTWLNLLTKLSPNEFGTLRLQALWMSKDDKFLDKIPPRVERWASSIWDSQQDSRQRTQLCLTIGNLYTAVGLHAEAERWFRRLLQFAPDAYQPLVGALLAQGRADEAVELCDERARSDASIRPAMALATALSNGNPKLNDLRLADPLLTRALAAHPDNVDLLFSTAFIRTLEGRTEEALKLYEKVRELRGRHVPTLNNIAALLAEMPGREEEGLALIDEAIKIAGPQPALLDTKAMVMLPGNPRESIKLLQLATAAPNADARYHFHLAVAYVRAGDKYKARDPFKRAKADGLDGLTLTHHDQRLLTELQKNLQR